MFALKMTWILQYNIADWFNNPDEQMVNVLIVSNLTIKDRSNSYTIILMK